jgi:hypothetical protein
MRLKHRNLGQAAPRPAIGILAAMPSHHQPQLAQDFEAVPAKPRQPF